jgi:hypothetical protein
MLLRTPVSCGEKGKWVEFGLVSKLHTGLWKTLLAGVKSFARPRFIHRKSDDPGLTAAWQGRVIIQSRCSRLLAGGYLRCAASMRRESNSILVNISVFKVGCVLQVPFGCINN